MRDGKWEFVSDDAVARTDTTKKIYPKRGSIHAMVAHDVIWLHEACQERALAFSGDKGKKDITIPKVQKVDVPSVASYAIKKQIDAIEMWSGAIDNNEKGSDSQTRMPFNERRNSALAELSTETSTANSERDKVISANKKVITDEKQKATAAMTTMNAAVGEEQTRHISSLSEITMRWKSVIAAKEANGDYISTDTDPDVAYAETRRNREKDLQARDKEILREYARHTIRVNSIRGEFEKKANAANDAIVAANDAMLAAVKARNGTVKDATEAYDDAVDAIEEEEADALKGANISFLGSDYVRAMRKIKYDCPVYSASSRKLPTSDKNSISEGERVNRAFADIAASVYRLEARSLSWPSGRYFKGTVNGYTVVHTSEHAGWRPTECPMQPSDNRMLLFIGKRYEVGRIRSIRALLQRSGNAIGTGVDKSAVESYWRSLSKIGVTSESVCKKMDAEEDRHDKQVARIDGKHEENISELAGDHSGKQAEIDERYDKKVSDEKTAYNNGVRAANASYITSVAKFAREWNTTVKIDGGDGSQLQVEMSRLSAKKLNSVEKLLESYKKNVEKYEDLRKREKEAEDRRHEKAVEGETERYNGEMAGETALHASNVQAIKDAKKREDEAKTDAAENAYNASVNAAQNKYNETMSPFRSATDSAYEAWKATWESPDNPPILEGYLPEDWSEEYAAYIAAHDAEFEADKVASAVLESDKAKATAAYYDALAKIEPFYPEAREVWSYTAPSNELISDEEWNTTIIAKAVEIRYDFGMTIKGDFPDYEKLDRKADEEELNRRESGWLEKEQSW